MKTLKKYELEELLLSCLKREVYFAYLQQSLEVQARAAIIQLFLEGEQDTERAIIIRQQYSHFRETGEFKIEAS